ncbi:MAG: CARDB domain-containing protein [Flammeovirgaceae bacterium]
MMNPIPIKWSRLWLIGLALCFFGNIEVGFAQESPIKLTDKSKSVQTKKEDPKKTLQKKSSQLESNFKSKAITLPSLEDLEKKWPQLTQRERIAIMKEMLLQREAGSPEHKFVENKLGSTKAQQLKQVAKEEAKQQPKVKIDTERQRVLELKRKYYEQRKALFPKEAEKDGIKAIEKDPQLAKEIEAAKAAALQKYLEEKGKLKEGSNELTERNSSFNAAEWSKKQSIKSGEAYKDAQTIRKERIQRLKSTDSAVKRDGKSTKSDLERLEKTELQRREYDFLRHKNPSTGAIDAGIQGRSLAFAKSLNTSFAGARTTAAGDQTSPWTQRGPYNVGGRTRAIGYDVRNEDILLAGSVSGGMWRSTDQGANWTRVTALADHPAVTDIVQDTRAGQEDTWYYSTGEFLSNATLSSVFPDIDFNYQGNGVYKSLDNGVTWLPLISTANLTPQTEDSPFDFIWDIALNPVNGDVYLSTHAGVFRSTDGGATFLEVLPGVLGSISHVEITSGGVVYAAIASDDTNEGIYRSTTGNAGDWTNITDAGFPTGAGRITLGIAAAPNENIVYILTSDEDIWKYTYTSGDGSGAGGTWEDRSANAPAFGGDVGDFSTQGGYSMYIRVHPTNPDLVFLGGANIFRSTDGFATNTNTSWIGGFSPANDISFYTNHNPDQHRLTFLLSDPNKALVASSGGVAMTDDITAANANLEQVTWSSLNNGYYTTQAYSVSYGAGDQLMVGAQDNGTQFTSVNDPVAAWTKLFDGSGGANFFNDDGTLRYTSFQFGAVARLEFADANSDAILNSTRIDPPVDGEFVTRFEKDPTDANTMFFAGQEGFFAITGVLFRNNDLPNATTTVGWEEIATSDGPVSTIGMSSVGPDVLYFGSQTGEIFRVDGARGPVADVVVTDVFTGKGLPAGYVSAIDVNAYDPNRVLVAFSNYEIPSLFFTMDGGETWTDVSGNLEQNADGSGDGPTAEIARIVGNEDLFIVGTSTGVYTTTSLNGAATIWAPVLEIGSVPIGDIRVRNSDGLVVVGTHGNGVMSATFETTEPAVVVLDNIPNVSVKQDAADVILDLSGIFESTVGDPLTLSVASNTNTGIVTTAMNGTDLTLSFVAGQTGEVEITIEANDTGTGSASTSFNVIVAPVISTFPYAESFESGDGGWTTDGIDNSWELGQPNGSDIVGASDGTEAWATGLTSSYNNDEESFVVSPCFDFTGVTNPVLFMDIWWDTEDSFDGGQFQSSIDGGTTWQTVGTIGSGTNWYNDGTISGLAFTGSQEGWTGIGGANGSGGYVEAVQNLSAFVGESAVLFRVVMGADISSTDDGLAFDNVRIVDLTDDLTMTGIDLPAEAPFSATEAITVNIENIGINPASNFDVTFEVDGNIIATEQVAGPLAAGDNLDYTFTATADLSAIGSHEVKAYLSTPDDLAANDTVMITVETLPILANFPYVESFESGDGDWVSGGALSSWELGQPNDDVIIGASDGTEAWTTGLTTDYNNNEASFVMSPYFDFSAVQNPLLFIDIWWEFEGGFDGAAIQFTTDLGNTWQTLGDVGTGENWYNDDFIGSVSNLGGSGAAWTGRNGDGSNGYVEGFQPLTALIGEPDVRFRVITGADFSADDDGFAFDNVRILDLVDDIEVADILVPEEGAFLDPQAVTVELNNLGLNPFSNFDLTYEVDGNIIATENVAGPVAVGGTLNYTFTALADLSAIGPHTIKAYLSTSDDFAANDTFMIDVITIPTISVFPYFEDYESGAGAWTAGGDLSTWELGTPNDDIIIGAASGTQAWTTGLTTNYNVFEQSFVSSPFFDFSGIANPYIFMDIWWDMENSFDGVKVEFTTDGGQTWEQLGEPGDTDNWYNDNTISGLGFTGSQEGWTGTGALGSQGYVPAYLPMNDLAGESSVRFRFVMGSDVSATDDGFAFDNIRIEDVDDDLELVDILLLPEKNFGDNEFIAVNIENVAANDQMDFTVTIEVDGMVTGSTTFPGPLASGDDEDFTVDFPSDLSVVGPHTVRAWLNADDFVGNDTFEIEVLTLPTIATFPYQEGFEGGSGFWGDGGDNSSWELGQPNGAIIDAASEGTEAWVTNLNGDYNAFEASFVTSPFFDFSSVVNPYIFLDIWYDVETGWDGASMQYTIDCGETWLNLGDLTTGTNWFNLNLPNSNPFGQNVLDQFDGNGDAWSGDGADGSGGYLPAFLDLSFLVGEPSVRFRILMASDNIEEREGFAFDNVQVIDVTDNLGINDILLLEEKNFDDAVTVPVLIANDGLNDMSNFNFTVEVDGMVAGTTTVTGPLVVGDEQSFDSDFTVDLSAIGPHTVRVWLDADDFVGNDTFEIEVLTLPTISTFPYNESFEADAGFWSAAGENSSWELGTPNKGVINGASDGTEAWVTDLFGSYNNFEESWVASPFFDFSAVVNPFVVFDVWWEIEADFDGAALQYTLDCGETWENVGSLTSGINWYNGTGGALGFSGGNGDAWTGDEIDGSGGYLTAIHELPELAGEPSVRFRVVLGADFSVTLDGFAFDNVTILDAPTEIGVVDSNLPSDGKFSDSEVITVTVENKGVQDLAANSTKIYLEVDGVDVTAGGEDLNVVVPVGGSVDYTFTATADLSTPGIRSVRAYIDNLDPIVANDTLELEILSVPLLAAFPYSEGFEGSDGFWYTTSENGINTWEHGEPDGSVINSAAEGNEAWVTDLDGPYLDSEQSYLNSPFFDFTSLANPVIRFAIWYDTETGFDGVSLQSSVDEGASWQNVGQLGGDGFNWYNGNVGPTLAFSGGNGDAWNDGSGEWLTAQLLLPQFAGVSCIQFRVVMGADALFFFPSNFDGVGIDDVLIKDVTDDVSVEGLGMEEAGVYSATTTILAKLKNNGINDASNFDIQYSIDGGTPVQETFTGTLAPGEEIDFPFTTTADLSALGNHDVEIEILTPDDLLNNNLFEGFLHTLDVIAGADYLENFESDPANNPSGELDEWFIFATTNYTWQTGQGETTSGSTGPSDDVSDPGDTYMYTEASFATVGDVTKLYTPGFDVTGFLHPTMSFNYHRFGADMGDLEVIVHDVASNTYTTVMTLTGAEHGSAEAPYTYTGYVPVDFLTGDVFSVLFRATRADGFTGDMAIDDVEVFDILDHDVTVSDFTEIDPFVPGQEVVEIEVENAGFQTQTDIPVAFTVNGGTPVTGIVPGDLASGETRTFVFSQLVDVSDPTGSYDFEIYTDLANDEDRLNDTLRYNFTHPGIVDTYPYVESFEGGPNGWRTKSESDVNSWEWGVPAGGNISDASDGNEAWVTNLDGDYQNFEESFIFGPIFDFSSLNEPVVLFDFNIDIEGGYDAAVMQSSIDNGRTWQNIGELGDFTNWYNVNTPAPLPGSSPVLDWTGGNGDGWTGSTGGTWITASHAAYDLAGESIVLLRIAFGSDLSFVQEGMGVDRFRVVERADLVNIDCADDLVLTTDPGDDIASSVMVTSPTINNGTGSEILVNSWTGTDDASGDFLVGYTNLDWAIFGGDFVDECTQSVLVTDEELPEIEDCPTDTVFLISSSLDSVTLDYMVPTITDNLQLVTYSGDQTLEDRGLPTCPGGAHGFLRIFDFQNDFEMDGEQIYIDEVEVGIQTAVSDQVATLNLYKYDINDPLDPASFRLVHTVTADMEEDDEFFFTFPVDYTVDIDSALVVEIVSDGSANDASFFYVASQPNQNRADNSYLNACIFGDLDDFGFAGFDWIINLHTGPAVDFSGIESGTKIGRGVYEQAWDVSDAYGNEANCEFRACVLLDSIVANPAINITTTSAELSWNELVGAEEYEVFLIRYGFNDTIQVISGIQNNSIVITPDPNISYLYSVRGKCGDVVTRSSNSEPVLIRPHTPTALDPTQVTSEGFIANWMRGEPHYNGTKFVIQVSQDNFATILAEESTVSGDAMTRDFPLGEGAFQYRVKATRRLHDSFDYVIESPYSNEIKFITPPAAPTDLIATPSTTGATPEVTLDWTDNSTVEDAYIIYKSVAGTGNFEPVVNPATGDTLFPANTETHIDTEVTATVSYAYFVVAVSIDELNNLNSTAMSNVAVSGLVSATIDELLESTTMVSPNPSTGIFNVRMDNSYSGKLTFELFDVAGRSMDIEDYMKSGVTLQRVVDLNGKQSGVYILRISSENGFITRRLMKH